MSFIQKNLLFKFGGSKLIVSSNFDKFLTPLPSQSTTLFKDCTLDLKVGFIYTFRCSHRCSLLCTSHSKWALVGDSLGWKMLWKGGGANWVDMFFCLLRCEPVVFQIHRLVHQSKIQAREKRTSESVKNVRDSLWKTPYGVGLYCDMVVSPTRAHLL